jgi:hypothetical protein
MGLELTITKSPHAMFRGRTRLMANPAFRKEDALGLWFGPPGSEATLLIGETETEIYVMQRTRSTVNNEVLGLLIQEAASQFEQITTEP